MNNSFVFYRSFAEACSELSDEQYGKIMRVINNYALDGIVPELTGVEKIIFTLIKPQIDANTTRKTNGCKGGAPSNNNNANKTTNGYTPKQPMVDLPDNGKQPMVDLQDNGKQPMVDFDDDEKQPNANANANANENENENVNAKVNAKPADKPQRSNFIKPTLDEVQAYCTERINNINAQRFIDFYESKGWLVGKNKMKDWRACVRTWEQRDTNRPRDATRGMTADDTLTQVPEF